MIVVDASVVIKWFALEPGSTAARALPASGDTLSAPSHVMAEAGRGLLRRKRAGDLSSSDAKLALTGIAGIVRLAPIEPLAHAAFDIADVASVTIYDALYVALAEQADGVVVTADRRLFHGLRSSMWAHRVQLLGEPSTSDRSSSEN